MIYTLRIIRFHFLWNPMYNVIHQNSHRYRNLLLYIQKHILASCYQWILFMLQMNLIN